MDSTINIYTNDVIQYKFKYLMEGLSKKHLAEDCLLRQSKMSELIVFISNYKNQLNYNDDITQQIKNIYLENMEILNNYWNDSNLSSDIQHEIISRVRSRMIILNDIIY